MASAEAADAGREEQELARRAQAGDDGAFEALVNRFSGPILNYCRRMVTDATTAEDLAQETFVKFYLALPSFDAGRPLSPYLYRIAHNHCLDWLRKRKLDTVALVWTDGETGEVTDAEVADITLAPDELAARAEIQAAVDEALASLPAEYRSPLVLRHQEGLSYEDIAAALELPLGTVKARIHRGREKLQRKLREFV